MGKEQFMSNMRFILAEDDLQRVDMSNDSSGDMVVTLDLHGYGRNKASQMLKNVIAITRGAFTMNVIHGFNHGTVLKEMLMEEAFSQRVIDKKCPAWNPGQTFLTIAA